MYLTMLGHGPGVAATVSAAAIDELQFNGAHTDIIRAASRCCGGQLGPQQNLHSTDASSRRSISRLWGEAAQAA